MGKEMHTVERDNVVEEANLKAINTDASASYHSALSSAINSKRKTRLSNSTNRFFYSVDTYNFLFEESLKVENLSVTAINKVPHTPNWCTGIISVRGVIMPVVDMRVVLKNEIQHKAKSKSPKKPHLLMVEHKNHAPIIIQIDKLPEIVNIKDYTYSEATKSAPSWQGKTWENSTNKLFEIDHDILFNKIRSN